jgi:DeoR/GlpR family transcriptional regulator of sugar metabolism
MTPPRRPLGLPACCSQRRRGVHTKFGVSSFCRFAEVTDSDTIVTDSALPALEAHRYSLLGPQVIRV